MAIKKRTKIDPAKLEAFAAGADEPSAPPEEGQPVPQFEPPVTESKPVGMQVRGGAQAKAWPEGLAKSLLIRWADPEQAQTLAAVASVLDRTQHKTALMALERGLQVLWNETQQGA